MHLKTSLTKYRPLLLRHQYMFNGTTKNHHDNSNVFFVVTGDTTGYRHDSFLCSQWHQISHHDVSVFQLFWRAALLSTQIPCSTEGRTVYNAHPKRSSGHRNIASWYHCRDLRSYEHSVLWCKSHGRRWLWPIAVLQTSGRIYPQSSRPRKR